MNRYLDLDRYPLHQAGSQALKDLVVRCRCEFHTTGMFNLAEMVRPDTVRQSVREMEPLFETSAYLHRRQHNIYFDDEFSELEPDHPALRTLRTENRKLCADQIAFSAVTKIYEWQPLIDFLAAVLEKPALYTMDDPLARINVMTYAPGQVLNWHFDRAEFTTTLLLQSATVGGEFQYRSDLRSDMDANYQGVAQLLAGEDPEVRTLPLSPGTLNVFKGHNSAHRITPVGPGQPRIVVVFSYFEKENANFSDAERLYFYGRTGQELS